MSAQVEEYDDSGCMCWDDDCPECGRCSYCRGDGWGIEGDTWDCDDPLWTPPGTVLKCPNCGGSGKASYMTFW
jgi:hypothetical protein